MKKVLYDILRPHNQEHLLSFWDELTNVQKKNLSKQIKNIDFDEIDELIEKKVKRKPKQKIPDDLTPPDYFESKPKKKKQKKYYKIAKEKGAALVRQLRLAVFTVAGGQGSRLGYDGPKGTFPITPVEKKSLFQYFAEVIRANESRYGAVIPWYILTSTINNEQTQEFFSENNYFGLKKNNVIFIVQGTMPAIDYNGKILMEDKDSIALAPNGHGGSLLALKTSGALDDMRRRGIKHISYFQVDNPLVSIINPLFIGLHNMARSEMSSIMIRKTGPYEKIGNFCNSAGKLQIIEYSDLPEELAEKRNKDGSLSFIAGSPAIHLIKRSFVERLTEGGTISLPWHRADKKVSYIDDSGKKVIPEKPNSVKLETFIFDALPLAERTIILEAKREDEFAPTKNKTGVDSVDTCRKMLVERDVRWIEKAADIKIPRKENGKINCTVELNRLSYLDERDIKINKKKIIPPAAGEKVYYK
ncbi:MAG: UDPGP type 1 family protein [Victivallales bacterium]|nr:UDPGP type 1 family protein [Victivallales bacterium]